MNDIYYKARIDALAKCREPRDDYQVAKAFPPYWCTPERWNGLCDLFYIDAEFQKRSTVGKSNRGKQEIRSTSESRSHNDLRAELATKLCREPTMAKWWTASHTSGSEHVWSTQTVKDVLDRYTFLYQEKYGDDNVDEHPAFDKKLWKQVLMERNEGSSSRKQGLGGLDPYYSEDTTIGSSTASTGQYRPTPQPSFNSEYFSSQLSQMATTLESFRSDIRSEIRNEIRTEVRNEIRTEVRNEIRDEIHTLEDRLVRRYIDEQEKDLASNDEDDFEEYKRRRRSIHASSSKGKGKQVGSRKK